MRTALLYCEYGSRASYYDDWRDAFEAAATFETSAFNIAEASGRDGFARAHGEVDLTVLLHSVNADHLTYANQIKPLLQDRRGRLLSFVGNELSMPGAPMAPKIAFLKEIGADFVATQLLLDAGMYLYADTGARVAAIPHALNPVAFRPGPLEGRPIDIGLRSFRYPAVFMGDNERNTLIDRFGQDAPGMGLTVDISTDARMARPEWAAFLNSCRGTVSNEAGGYWIERDDATMTAIRDWLQSRQGAGITIGADSSLRRLAHKLPWRVRQWLAKAMKSGPIRHESLIGGEDDFDEAFERFFSDKPFPPEVTGKCISSRHFDAIGTMTCQVMIRGRYNDILQADEHYIPMSNDLSDMAEAVEKFRDTGHRETMVRRTHDYVMAEHTHTHRIAEIERLISADA